ncbi:helix-turn-helix transcriptional regulator [Kitasatospora sp. MAP5-34]|uniref:helix-turn-helix domain-containing protein n=1 Tax=Kitasatospora sp. MAP5-34 TaxID=3035102 RepID=UPI002472F2DE|nr:helix-turn-helix transcriptional regulator [Kitasatospora sp. MAP5-34]MDH6578243.1 transcriptional regulator with XRE-family HTH domain [Kitasatospora sp. MAP5-34]
MLEPEHQGHQRKDLAQALRDLRQASGLSGERLAVRCNMSQAKISRIETGKTLPTVIDVERILAGLEVPEEVLRDLVALARAANVDYTAWWTYARLGLYQKQAELKALEESSRRMRHFLPAIPTGLLHVPAYATRTLSKTLPSAPALDVARAVQARMDRQAVLDDQSRHFTFLMTEQAVRWQRASLPVMAEQAVHMAEVAEKPNVEIAVIPQSVQVPATPMNIFVIYDNRLVTVELFSGEVVLRNPQDVSYHLDLFELFMSHALTGADATDFLRRCANDFMRERE